MLDIIIWLFVFYLFYYLNIFCYTILFNFRAAPPLFSIGALIALILSYIFGWKYVVRTKDPWKMIVFVGVIFVSIIFGYTR